MKDSSLISWLMFSVFVLILIELDDLAQAAWKIARAMNILAGVH